jgi:hypothetical protein
MRGPITVALLFAGTLALFVALVVFPLAALMGSVAVAWWMLQANRIPQSWNNH